MHNPANGVSGSDFHQDRRDLVSPKREPLLVDVDDAGRARLEHFDQRPLAQSHFLQPVHEVR